MMKLTLSHAAFAPLRGRAVTRSVAVSHSRATVRPEKAAAPRRGLTCRWTKDETGHLVCSWSDDASDQSLSRRDIGRAGPILPMAA